MECGRDLQLNLTLPNRNAPVPKTGSSSVLSLECTKEQENDGSASGTAACVGRGSKGLGISVHELDITLSLT